jgi:hypothetical protein
VFPPPEYLAIANWKKKIKELDITTRTLKYGRVHSGVCQSKAHQSTGKAEKSGEEIMHF